MSTLLSNPTIREAIVPISVEQYQRMGAVGIIDEKTELIRGVILRKMNKSPLHRWTVTKLLELLSNQIPDDYFVQSEQPLGLIDSEPEPDISIIRGSNDDYRMAHPNTAQLVIEVAITTEALDRVKASVYAEAQIPEYWLVLPEKTTIERFSNPAKGIYQETETCGFDKVIHLPGILGIQVDFRRLS